MCVGGFNSLRHVPGNKEKEELVKVIFGIIYYIGGHINCNETSFG